MSWSSDENRPTAPDILTTTGSRVVCENRWMRVREDTIRRRDGSAGIYGVIDKRDFVVIAPVDAGIVHLVQQYRYPVQGRWPPPAASGASSPESVLSPYRCDEMVKITRT